MGCPGKDWSEVGLLLLRDEFKNGIEGILPRPAEPLLVVGLGPWYFSLYNPLSA